MGPPGAGKGTQCAGLAETLGVPSVSTGDMFRALQHADTPLAVRVRSIMASGGYVDDDTTNAIVDDRLGTPDCADGFLLDGYPRTVDQVRHLDEQLDRTGTRLDAVVCLEADEDEVVRRLLARGQAQGRSDDTDDTIRARLAVYREQTAPLLDEYRSRGLLVTVDAIGSIGEVTQRIDTVLTSLLLPSSPTG
jgi:adenylate kinase